MHAFIATCFLGVFLLMSGVSTERYVKPGSTYPYPRPDPPVSQSGTSSPQSAENRPKIVYVPYPVYAINTGFYNGLLSPVIVDESIQIRRERNAEEPIAQYPLEYIGPIGEEGKKPGVPEDLLWKEVKPCKNCAPDRKHVIAQPKPLGATGKPAV